MADLRKARPEINFSALTKRLVKTEKLIG